MDPHILQNYYLKHISLFHFIHSLALKTEQRRTVEYTLSKSIRENSENNYMIPLRLNRHFWTHPYFFGAS